MALGGIALHLALPGVLALSSIIVAGCSDVEGAGVVKTGFALGTLVRIRAYGEAADRAVREAFARVQEIEAEMSPDLDRSQVVAVNRQAGGLPTRVSHDTLYVVEKARRYGELSQGKFDVAIGPLVRLWGIGTDHAKVPALAEIERARSLMDYRDIEVDTAAGTVRLSRSGMALDLGAIAKGFAADEVASVLARWRVKSAFIDLGGNILVVGSRPDGSPWRVGIQDPWKDRGATFATVSISDMAVVSSGSYERYFERGGRRYHHILDPETGFPANTGIVSATVLARRSIDADALSTTVFLLGPKDGMNLISRLPGVDGIIVTDDRRVIASPGLDGLMEVNEGWTVEFHGAEDNRKG